MKELHVLVTRDYYGTYTTNFLNTPPKEGEPLDIFEIWGYRVGVYVKGDLPEPIIEQVVRDAVHQYLKGL